MTALDKMTAIEKLYDGDVKKVSQQLSLCEETVKKYVKIKENVSSEII